MPWMGVQQAQFETVGGEFISLSEEDISWIEDGPNGQVTVQTRSGPKHSLRGSTESIYARFQSSGTAEITGVLHALAAGDRSGREPGIRVITCKIAEDVSPAPFLMRNTTQPFYLAATGHRRRA